MGTFPPPGHSDETKTTRHGPSAEGVLYGVAFVVLSALIFTTTLKHDHDNPPPPVVIHSPLPDLPLTYPPARKVDASDTFFGVKVPGRSLHRWLEDVEVARRCRDGSPTRIRSRAATSTRFPAAMYLRGAIAGCSISIRWARRAARAIAISS